MGSFDCQGRASGPNEDDDLRHEERQDWRHPNSSEIVAATPIGAPTLSPNNVTGAVSVQTWTFPLAAGLEARFAVVGRLSGCVDCRAKRSTS